MNLMDAMRDRRSCRDFAPDDVPPEAIEQILEAASWAPSPLNAQPWEFCVVSGKDAKARIHAEAVRCRDWAMEKSGWKWLANYGMDFLLGVPVMIGVAGDPAKSGVDQFMPQGAQAYQHACAAAIQNMQLAAHALGLGSLWFTFFDKAKVAEILGVAPGRDVVALVCLGKAKGAIKPVPRKDVQKLTRHIR